MNLKPASITYSILWLVVAALAILMIPSLVFYGKPVWQLTRESTMFVSGLALTYFATGVIVTIRARLSEDLRVIDIITTGVAVFGLYALFLLLTKAYQERAIFVAAVAMSGIFILVPFILASSIQRVLIIVMVALVLTGQLLGNRSWQFLDAKLGRDDISKRSAKIIDSAYYSISMDFYDNYLDKCDAARGHCDPPRAGGAISVFDDGYLLTTGDGTLYSVAAEPTGDSLAIRPLPYRVPLNSEDFTRDVGAANLPRFRVTGAVVQKKKDSFRLFVAHHHWKSTEKCFVFRVSSLEAEYKEFLAGTAKVDWKTVYETAPCLKFNGGTFYGDESGGRIVLLDDHSLLLSVGDFSMDGLSGGNPLAQDMSTEYGKTIKVDIKTGKGIIFSVGHRNPQGLHVDQHGKIYETEHGPRGGDELNIISEGKNYGWPFVTYGTHMLSHSWPMSAKQGEHDGFELPVYAWVPDVAISNLVKVRGELFDRWRDDLLIGSYTKRLWRVRIREGRVIYTEPIEIRGKNARIRDILEDPKGQIVLLLDGGSIVMLKPTTEEKHVPEGVAGADSMRGQLLFTQCRSCHDVKDGSSHRIGPDLAGIVGRQIGRASNFNYSSTLAGSNETWSEERLDKFLANPQQFAAGTSMAFTGIPDPADRAQLIRFLKTLK